MLIISTKRFNDETDNPIFVVGDFICVDGDISPLQPISNGVTKYCGLLENEAKTVNHVLTNNPDKYGKANENFAELVKSTEVNIRRLVARNKECLDILVKDDYWYVRAEVARTGSIKHLNQLTNDVDELVRESAKEAFNELHDKMD